MFLTVWNNFYSEPTLIFNLLLKSDHENRRHVTKNIYIADRQKKSRCLFSPSDSMEEPEPVLNPPSSLQEPDPPLSKNALKRQLKRQRWEESKEERRAQKKARLKEKKETLKLKGQKRPKKAKVEGQENSGIRVVIDCAFDDYMTEKVSSFACLGF
jgi:hypothetical protein